MAFATAALNPPPLPSLNALQAFEAASRHLSFTRAARELGVTQTAISHQVRALEKELGVLLFRRSPQRISLTREGQAWAVELGVVFTRLRDANRNLRRSHAAERPAVSVSIIPSLASRWLVPRLGRFLVEHPEIDVRISAGERLVDFALEPVDLGIRYGAGGYSGLASTKLADDAFVVVASPSLHAKRSRWTPPDLAKETLLHDDYPDAWARWFAAVGSRMPERVRQNQLTDSAMLVEAVLRTQGVGLARWSLVVDELQSERLKLVFPKLPPLPTGLAYYIVCPRENLRREAVSAFRDWVRREAASLLLG
ncbi:MAG TPA: transcriptional regulator GcvA [Polyangiaceae bacterium]|jgi:LysR family glycine cleavage system transcriptional activator|nr:transcriptional regulator GcvA [Polyangiaceae bacterium]